MDPAVDHQNMIQNESEALSRPAGALNNVDGQLVDLVKQMSSQDSDFWTFSELHDPRLDGSQYQYPARMIPGVQRELLRIALELNPAAQNVLDPFAGSGTVLQEAMSCGLAARMQDTNPLAILICQVRTGPFQIDELRSAAAEVFERAKRDSADFIDVDFHGLAKWFRQDVARELSSLRRSIMEIPSIKYRRFFWVALAETVRQTSNSRTSTYKLHIRPQPNIDLLPSAIGKFRQVIERNIAMQARTAEVLRIAGFLKGDEYIRSTECVIADSRRPIRGKFDLLVTSPPYGDPRTTVPYGQNSYLPLQWIDLLDIDTSLNSEWVANTHKLDSLGLGGVLTRKRVNQLLGEAPDRSPSLRRFLESVMNQPADRAKRGVVFAEDFLNSLVSIVDSLKDNAYLFWTVGNRRIGGEEFPFDSILTELLHSLGVAYVTSAARRIPSKRMPSRNAIASTMKVERLMVFRKAGC